MHQTQGDDELLGLLPAAVGAVDAQPAVEAILNQVVADLGFPIGPVTGVLPGVQVLAGATGLDGWLAEARATPVEWSLCAADRDVARLEEAAADAARRLAELAQRAE